MNSLKLTDWNRRHTLKKHRRMTGELPKWVSEQKKEPRSRQGRGKKTPSESGDSLDITDNINFTLASAQRG